MPGFFLCNFTRLYALSNPLKSIRFRAGKVLNAVADAADGDHSAAEHQCGGVVAARKSHAARDRPSVGGGAV